MVFRRKGRKAPRRKQRAARRPTKLVNRAVNPIPERYICKMKYSDTFQLTSGGGSLYRFNLNSIFDPNRTGVGHQPYGHDQYDRIYNHYKVNYSTIVLTPVINGEGMFGCTITDDPTINVGFDTVKEIKNTNMKAMGANGVPDKVTQYYNKNQVYTPASDGIGANFGANPSEQAFFHVWFTAKDSTSTPTLILNVSIAYNVTMSELKDLGSS